MKTLNRLWRKFRSPRNRVSLVIALGCGFALSLFLSFAAAQQPVEEIGWEFLGSRNLNEGAITETIYTGECDGHESSNLEARFTSTRTLPAPGRRVRITNVTRGVAGDNRPYTDRKYEEGTTSESTAMAFGARHALKTFNVLEGENQFTYEIKQNDRVIDSGSFTAVIEKEEKGVVRNAVMQKQSVCQNAEIPLQLCADVREQEQKVCPNNRILSTVYRPSNNDTTTLIANQSSSMVEYRINDQETRRLPPGEQLRIQGDSLNLQYSRCAACGQSFVTLPLQPGRRYQFRPALDGLIELSDFPKGF